MDDWLPKGSWVKLGMQQTPYIDYVDTISRYRFQGPAFTDRQKLLSSADTGLVARIAYPKDYGDAQFGFYNGESYTASEANNEKSFQMRLSVRPGASVPILKGWRLAFFKDWDATMDHAVRDRTAWNTTFEHKWVNAGYEYVIAEDQALPTDPATRFQGYSVWVTPKLPLGFEIYARYDFAIPDMSQPARVTETIAGLAYWLPVQKGVSTAILLDYDRTIDQRPDHWEVRRYTLHAMVQF
jgi:hypothetical protein